MYHFFDHTAMLGDRYRMGSHRHYGGTHVRIEKFTHASPMAKLPMHYITDGQQDHGHENLGSLTTLKV